MGRAWDTSANHRRFGGRAESVGLQQPETAAVWSKFAAVPSSSTVSKCDGPRSALVGAARKDARAMNCGLEPIREGHVPLSNCR